MVPVRRRTGCRTLDRPHRQPPDTGSRPARRQLAEGFALAEGDEDHLLAVLGGHDDLDQAAGEHVQAAAGIALVEEPGVPREGALDRPVGQRRQGLLVKLREQPGATEERDGHLGAHRPPPNVQWPRPQCR
jgi:hypothetical protein